MKFRDMALKILYELSMDNAPLSKTIERLSREKENRTFLAGYLLKNNK